MEGQVRAILMEQLSRHEGMRLRPYRCTAGKLTIGIGRNLDDHGISEEEAFQMLENDMEETEELVCQSLPRLYEQLNPARKAVLLNMAFNMGIGNGNKGLLSFKKTLSHMASGEFDKAADGMLASKWARQVGQRAVELSEIMRKGA